ncbi:hypothetical protein EV361DRAFT_926300 [Lentinula raphanica]|uniref:Uncharacterized protein n=1 Tax=Lentinula raphanica TaxID=153919 RepID=A0AA38P7S7_9AGAR|nr:hypothetical protein F5880DRAFT_1586498 [Lentinula raphanica]KAJ3837923.1 hypothetical protein F5878DRAFT_620889 [Lentinula raphanica]KAJ3968375.1 hypothetical protein EV361DRAFT_926300 [Lentinula raphanica]
MVLPIVRTISMASLFLILLASALAPGLMAAPLSVSVQMPPIEQNVERRDYEIPIYVRRRTTSVRTCVSSTKKLKEDEWVEILVGENHVVLLQASAGSENEWTATSSRATGPATPYSRLHIGTVFCPSREVEIMLFGQFERNGTLSTHGLIHRPFHVLYEINKPQPTPVDRSLAVVELESWLATGPEGITYIRAHINPQDPNSPLVLADLMMARTNWFLYSHMPVRFEWDISELENSGVAWHEANAWNLPDDKKVVLTLPDYYRRLKDTEDK